MLVLTRKSGESIVVGSNIRVKIVEVQAGVVRIGIEAPSDVSILREELYSEIEKANLGSVATGPTPKSVVGRLRGRKATKKAP